MPAWAASTSSSTTPIRVTATPATASTLPIQPSERSGRGLGGAGIVIGGGGGVGRGTYACRWGQYGAGGGAYGITGGTYGAGCAAGAASRLSNSVRSDETRANWCEIAAKSAESRAMTACCGSVMPSWSQRADESG